MRIHLPFYKVVGAGNDCIVVHANDLDALKLERAKVVRSICHRTEGIGADQFFELLSVDPLAVQVWNCDGTKAEMCANGTRSFLLLAREQSWVDIAQDEVRLFVSGSQYQARWTEFGYELCLGAPVLLGSKQLRLKGESLPYHSVSVGNPHAVIFTRGRAGDWQTPNSFRFQDWGPIIEHHTDFPNRTNVEFVRQLSVQDGFAKVLIEVWERGAGATLSCGTGAVAVAAALWSEDNSLQRFSVTMNDFTLHVRIENNKAYLCGPSRVVASGDFYVNRT